MERDRGAASQVIALLHAGVGWAICGATVDVARHLVSMRATLSIHAVVAPVAFGVLTWRYFKRFPAASVAGTSITMLAVPVSLDLLVVAPLIEHGYAMFRSVLGTWLPFASIGVTSYLVGRAARRRPGGITGRRGGAVGKADRWVAW